MVKLRVLGSSNSQPNEVEIVQVDPFINPETVTINKELDGQKTLLFKGTLTPQGPHGPPPPPPNQPPVINTNTSITTKVNQEVTLTANIVDPDGILEDVNWVQIQGTPATLTKTEEPNGVYKAKFTPTVANETVLIELIAVDNQAGRTAKRISVLVDPVVIPPPTGDILYDSHRDSKLHDGIERTIRQEGNISAGGLGVECRASGNPRIKVNADKTFSLLCDSGHGRFYGYCKNYNATMIIECAFWNKKSGQDLSLKMRSRHNESGSTCDGGSPITANRFGGYGLAVDFSGWGAKREPTHNCHDQSKSGNTPSTPQVQQFFTIEFTVKDDGGKVKQIGKYNGQEFMNKTDDSPKPFMVDKALYDAQSYFWVRQNIDSGTGEIRIKSLVIKKAV